MLTLIDADQFIFDYNYSGESSFMSEISFLFWLTGHQYFKIDDFELEYGEVFIKGDLLYRCQFKKQRVHPFRFSKDNLKILDERLRHSMGSKSKQFYEIPKKIVEKKINYRLLPGIKYQLKLNYGEVLLNFFNEVATK